jgi:hypothetical protein
MRLIVISLVLLMGCAAPSVASATWSPAMDVPLSSGVLWPAVAVNARGDAAIGWIQEGRAHGHATVRVRAALRTSGSNRYRVHTLLARRDVAARGVAVALDARGELTVAWIEQASDAGSLHGHKTIRAAYRRSDGRWSSVQSVGRSAAFNNASPRLTALPDGSVALTYNAFTSGPSGVAAAWRSPGRSFGRAQTVPVGHDHLLDPALATDPAGTVYLTGTRGCTRSDARVFVAVAPSGRRRFTSRVVVSGTPGKSARLAVIGAGTVAASWLSGRCNTTEDSGGVPMATTIRDGHAAAPVALGTDAAISLVTSPVAGGADVSFATFPSTMPGGTLMTAHVLADGTVGAPAPPADGWIALAGDAAGDRLIGHPDPNAAVVTPLAARSVTGRADEPAPVPAVGGWNTGVVAAPTGRALAVLSFRPLSSMTPAIVLTVWRP